MYNGSSNGSPSLDPIQLHISTVTPAQIREQAVRFAHFTDKVLGRLNRSGARLCRRCLHELHQHPQHYDRTCAYHVELLARAIRRELDVLYRCLRVDTMDVIDRSYQHWIRRKNRPKPPRPPEAC